MAPQSGYFLAPDPLLYLDSVTAYDYVGQSPTNFSDPTGATASLGRTNPYAVGLFLLEVMHVYLTRVDIAMEAPELEWPDVVGAVGRAAKTVAEAIDQILEMGKRRQITCRASCPYGIPAPGDPSGAIQVRGIEIAVAAGNNCKDACKAAERLAKHRPIPSGCNRWKHCQHSCPL
jgi:hypothetical protein